MPTEPSTPHQQGLVVASYGRHVMVEAPDGSRRICQSRGKKNQALTGDNILWSTPLASLASPDAEGAIEQILPRRNLFYRQDDVRTKAFAANIDQVLIWLAAEPGFSYQLLGRALIAAEAAGIAPLIVLNKADLSAAHAQGWHRLVPYRAMGYEVLSISLLHDHAGHDLQRLQAALQNKKTLVMGPSGSGKSTLINRLLPDANVQTNAISRALNSGKHTTTATVLYWVNRAAGTAVIDSPGFQEFGIRHISARELPGYMPDIAAHTGQCRFHNCTHLHEPGCQVLAAMNLPLEQGGIAPQRHLLYAQLHAELSQARY